jgi:hypothetical protein
MSATEVLERDLVRINGVPYRVKNGVQEFSASQQPGKVVIGDWNPDTHPLVSTWSINDNRLGLGVNQFDAAVHVGRFWYSNCNIRHRNHMILQRIQNDTTYTVGSEEISQLATFNTGSTEEAFGIFTSSGTIRKASNATPPDWGAEITGGDGAIGSAATDSVSGLITVGAAKVNTLVFATGTLISYSNAAGTSFTKNSTVAIKYVHMANDILWGMTNAGVLYSAVNMSAAVLWTEEAQLPLAIGAAKGIFSAKFYDGITRILVSAHDGVWAYDPDNQRFERTPITMPIHPTGGAGFAVWRNSVYWSSGMMVIEWTVGSATPIWRPIGMDLDDGVPASRRGNISKLVPTLNELIAVVDGNPATATVEQFVPTVSSVAEGSVPNWLTAAGGALAGTEIGASDDVYATWVGDDATNVGDTSAGTAVNVLSGGDAWANPTNCIASDNSYTVTSLDGLDDLSDLLYADTFGINIADTAIVRGIEVKIERKASSGTAIVDELIQLTTDGSTKFSDNKADAATNWPATDGSVTYGSSTDLWGFSSLSVAEIEAAAFGVRVKVRSSTNADASIDHITINVYYSAQQTSDILRGDMTGSQFTVPASATVKGVVATVERSSVAGDNVNTYQDAQVHLRINGSDSTEDKAVTGDNWPTTDASVTYGGAGDLWGSAISVAHVNQANFGIDIQVTGENGNGSPRARIDSVKLAVTYTVRDSTMYGWNTQGWQVWGEGITQNGPIDDMVLSQENSNYRLFWAENQLVKYFDMPQDIDNPAVTRTESYHTSGTWESAWFEPAPGEESTLALQVRMDSTHPSTDETLIIEYALNGVDAIAGTPGSDDGNYRTIGTKTTDGITKYPLPNSTTPYGVVFRSIKFRVTWARGSQNVTSTPDMHRLSLIYIRRNEDLRGFAMNILIEPHNTGQTPSEQRDSLRAARLNGTLVKFEWQARGGTFYVQIRNFADYYDETGAYEGGIENITLMEPI